MANTVISLTTIPSRIQDLNITMDSLLCQTYHVDKIILNVAESYRRFPHIAISEYKHVFDKYAENPKIHVNYCQDYGPATKILPLLEEKFNTIVGEHTKIVFLDDDRKYDADLVERLCKQSDNYSDHCICISIWDTCSIDEKYRYTHTLQPRSTSDRDPGYGDIFLGCNGVLVKKNMLRCHNFDYHVQRCPQLFFQDDFFLSAILACNKVNIFTTIGRFADATQNAYRDELYWINTKQNYIICMDYLVSEFPIWKDA